MQREDFAGQMSPKSVHSVNVGFSAAHAESKGVGPSAALNKSMGVGNTPSAVRSRRGSQLSQTGLAVMNQGSEPKTPSKLPSMVNKSLGTNFRSGQGLATPKQAFRPNYLDDQKDWKLNSPSRRMTIDEADAMKRNCEVLRTVEDEIAGADAYVQHCTTKYKNFNFNMKLFMDDELIKDAKFEENYPVKNGQFKDNVFWGQHITEDGGRFMPHGFCLFVDRKNKIMHIGSFKNGKEYGQQRVIQSYPLKSRYFTQFTSVQG